MTVGTNIILTQLHFCEIIISDVDKMTKWVKAGVRTSRIVW